MSPAPSYLVFATPLALWVGARLGGGFALLPVGLVFLLLPLLDESVGAGGSAAALPRPERLRFDLPLWLWIPWRSPPRLRWSPASNTGQPRRRPSWSSRWA